ncbi:MAG: glycosyltransferase, partial [Candidatus Omnitrophota bacterium]
MIKVLYVLTKPELGGAQKHVLSLLVGLDKSRFDLNLFTASKGYLIDRFCDIPGVHVHKSSFLKRDLSLFNDIPALFELYFYIRKNKFDVVHTHSSKAGILGRMAAWLAGVRCVVHTVHGWSFNAYQHKFVYLAYVFLERLCARCTHVLVVVSSIERTQGVALKIIPLGEYVLIHCGIRHEDYRHTDDQKIDLRQQLGIDPGCCVVGTVA